jgi:Fic family protein
VRFSCQSAEAAVQNPTYSTGPDSPQAAGLAAAYKFAFSSLSAEPLSTDLMARAHRHLLKGSRGSERAGQVRTTQNWVGDSIGPHAACYVPPPPEHVFAAMSDLNEFLRCDNPLPPCVHAITAFGQFEMIHPFSDGNGRLGRLLLLLVLASRGLEAAGRSLPIEAHLRKRRGPYLAEMIYLQSAWDWDRWTAFMLAMLTDCAREIVAEGRNHEQRRRQRR